MLKPIIVVLLSFLLPLSNITSSLFISHQNESHAKSVLLEKMIIERGKISLNIDLDRLNGNQTDKTQNNAINLEFDIEDNSFFTIFVYDGKFRGSVPGSMNMSPRNSAFLPPSLNGSYNNLLLEQMPFGEHYEFVIRDRKSGFIFFTIEGHLPAYNPTMKTLSMNSGRVRISKEFAQELKRPEEAETLVGTIDIRARMQTIETAKIADGKLQSNSLPAGIGKPENAGTRPGPDVVVGDVYGLAQFGDDGASRVGLALGTVSCNYGTRDLNWFQLPDNDHPVIPQNLYRMSADGIRFEQIGQSQVKHAFWALRGNICELGCNGVGGTSLGSGCSDPYSAGLNAGPNLGSKAWINPFTGFYPMGNSATPPNNHNGHSHSGTSHRILTESNDLSTQMNNGARYFAEGQYVTPHEYDWCQKNPGQCNMNNNVSYREYEVSGVQSPFGFTPLGETIRESPAIKAWTGATFVQIQPDAASDGIATLAYKVTEVSPGNWHYEYALYNQNLDRAIQSFSVSIGEGVSISNVGFHAPPQHPGSLNDGTFNDEGFSESPWTPTQTATNMTWNSETITQNQNANALRWGTMYNFRFKSTSPPQSTNASIEFFKTGSPVMVQTLGPGKAANAPVLIAGRVTNGDRAVFFARVQITDSKGNNRMALTNPFGYYRFKDVPVGETYTVSVFSKSHTFTPQTLQIDKTITNLNFEAEN